MSLYVIELQDISNIALIKLLNASSEHKAFDIFLSLPKDIFGAFISEREGRQKSFIRNTPQFWHVKFSCDNFFTAYL